MYFAKATIFLAALVASAQVAVAANPACLIGAINSQTQTIPSDLSTLCGSESAAVQAAIESMCGSNTNAALSAFASACESAGHAVSIVSGTASGTATPTASGSATGSAGSVTTSMVVYSASTEVFQSTFYNSDCSCTTTMAVSTILPASTGFAPVTIPASLNPAAATGAASPSSTAGAAVVQHGSYAAFVIGAGILMAM